MTTPALSTGRYRKRPVEVEAIEVEALLTDALEFLPAWVLDARRTGVLRPCATVAHGFLIATLEGSMVAHRDDWIIRGIKGELYPCRADIFAETYEPVLRVSGGEGT